MLVKDLELKQEQAFNYSIYIPIFLFPILFIFSFINYKIEDFFYFYKFQKKYFKLKSKYFIILILLILFCLFLILNIEKLKLKINKIILII